MQNFIKRKLYTDLKKHLSEKEISLITGPRQAGKTTLMNILKSELDLAGEKTIFFSLDFDKDKPYFNSQQELIAKLDLEFGRNKGYVFIDEIQRKEDAGLFLKGMYDMNLPYKFIVSGSGSVELKEKVHESLAGRKKVFILNTISFEEFVNFRTGYKYENNLLEFFKVEKNIGQSLLNEYLNFGGYPKVVIKKMITEKQEVIREILTSYLERDIRNLVDIEKIETFNMLVRLLADQSGKIINYTELSNTLDIRIETLKKYIWYMEKTFIAKRITPFFRNARKEIVKAPILYFYDLGLKNFAIDIFGNLTRADDIGFSFQNFIFLILSGKGVKLNFWRTKDKNEVDFVIDLAREVIPIEVKYKELSKPEAPASLKNFIKKYSPTKAIVVNKNYSFQTKFKDTDIMFMPFWQLIEESWHIRT